MRAHAHTYKTHAMGSNAQTLLTLHSSLTWLFSVDGALGVKGALGISCSPELKFRSLNCRSSTRHYLMDSKGWVVQRTQPAGGGSRGDGRELHASRPHPHAHGKERPLTLGRKCRGQQKIDAVYPQCSLQ